MPLTEQKIRTFKLGQKPDGKKVKRAYKVFDGQGLYVEVPCSGNRRWRLKYRMDGKEKLLALGTWPKVSLKEARSQAAQARAMIDRGIDPSKQKSASPNARLSESESLQAITTEWLEHNRERWVPKYHKKLKSRLDAHLLPYLGEARLQDITAPDLLKVLRRIEDRGTIKTAHGCTT